MVKLFKSGRTRSKLFLKSAGPWPMCSSKSGRTCWSKCAWKFRADLHSNWSDCGKVFSTHIATVRQRQVARTLPLAGYWRSWGSWKTMASIGKAGVLGRQWPPLAKLVFLENNGLHWQIWCSWKTMTSIGKAGVLGKQWPPLAKLVFLKDNGLHWQSWCS